jgi:hypothetical protein
MKTEYSIGLQIAKAAHDLETLIQAGPSPLDSPENHVHDIQDQLEFLECLESEKCDKAS